MGHPPAPRHTRTLDEAGRELFQTLRIPSLEVGRRSASAAPQPSEIAGGTSTGSAGAIPAFASDHPALSRMCDHRHRGGEKDADRAVADGYAATCRSDGRREVADHHGERPPEGCRGQCRGCR